MNDSKKVFVIYGRDKQLYEYIQKVLCAFGLSPLLWHEARAQAQKHKPIVHTLDIVKRALSQSKVMLALLSPDEVVTLKKNHQNVDERDLADIFPSEQARPNVIFEIGLAIGLARNGQKIHVIVCNKCRLLSDFAGVEYLKLEYDDFRGFVKSLRTCLHTDGLKVDDIAYEDALNVPTPIKQKKPYMHDQHDILDGIALSLKQRGDYKQYIGRIMDAKNVRIMGVSQESIVRHIINCLECGGEALDNLRMIEIKLLIAGNKTYTNLIDHFERQYPRDLFSCNIKRAVKLAKLKQDKSFDNLDFRMHLYANSVTMIAIDGVIWITPYTNLDGNQAPTFVVDETENPSVYRTYIDMFDAMWRDAVLVNPAYNETDLISQLNNIRKVLEV